VVAAAVVAALVVAAAVVAALVVVAAVVAAAVVAAAVVAAAVVAAAVVAAAVVAAAVVAAGAVVAGAVVAVLSPQAARKAEAMSAKTTNNGVFLCIFGSLLITSKFVSSGWIISRDLKLCRLSRPDRNIKNCG
jgi:hypothetical protein